MSSCDNLTHMDIYGTSPYKSANNKINLLGRGNRADTLPDELGDEQRAHGEKDGGNLDDPISFRN